MGPHSACSTNRLWAFRNIPADADWYASTSETVHVLSQKTAKQEELFGEPHVPASSDLPVIWGSHPAFHEMTIMTIYFTLCGCSSLAMGNHLIFSWNVYEKIAGNHPTVSFHRRGGSLERL
jgi:hypothetical protein